LDDQLKILRFDWTDEQASLLVELGKEALGSKNRSEVFRVLTVMYCLNNNLMRLRPVTLHRLELAPPEIAPPEIDVSRRYEQPKPSPFHYFQPKWDPFEHGQSGTETEETSPAFAEDMDENPPKKW
jgi:hypothetical protein